MKPRQPEIRRRLMPLAITGGGTLLAAFIYYWAQYVEPFRLETTYPTIICPRLPASLDGLRVLFLADQHTGEWTRRETLVEAQLRRLPAPPDLLVWGGDFLYHFGRTDAAIEFVTRVQAQFPHVPSFGILGNAEHKITPAQTVAFVQELEAAGISVLQNRSVPLRIHGQTITIAGVDDPYYGYDDLDTALAGCAANRFTLLLSHSPQIAYRAAKAGVDLMLSGHTHGGQVRLPFIGALRSQNALGRKMDQGLFDQARLRPLLNGRDTGSRFRLYVTRGIGVAPSWRFYWLRPRLFCRPEIVFLTLTRPASA